jgi:Domain of unknown function (DUF397)
VSQTSWRKSSYSGTGGSSCVEVAWQKSSYSGGEGSDCVEVAWQKSSYSGTGGSDCVEVAWQSRQSASVNVDVLLRDSKNPAGPVLTIPALSWQRLLPAIS